MKISSYLPTRKFFFLNALSRPHCGIKVIGTELAQQFILLWSAFRTLQVTHKICACNRKLKFFGSHDMQ
jgi:hypothetical protein